MAWNWLSVSVASGAEETPAAQRAALEQFEREVRPLFVAECSGCHGAKKQEGGLRVDSRDSLIRGGDSGSALVPGRPRESLLLKAARREGELRMPPDKPLAAEQIAAIERWIAAGAAWPVEATVATTRGGPITDDERRHWSFQPLRKAELPGNSDAEWSLTRVDRYLRSALDSRHLSPASEADRRTWLRRARLTITGLPPTRDEQREFSEDDSPDAHVRLVDRLLADPAQGERWGRHWLDVVRYADTAGDGADYPVPEAYRYRNYVIRSFAADKPYDQFLREQLAGDILANEGATRGELSAERYAELVTATGYLAVAKRFGYNVNTDFQHLDLADVIEGVGRSLFGLSIGCARCHDHKYDPINMTDYYSLYGIFASSRFSFPGGEEHKRPAFLAPLVSPTRLAELESERKTRLDALQQRVREAEGRRTSLMAMLPNDGGGEWGFESSPLGKSPGSPWFQAGPNEVRADSQSPFTNTYSIGTRGVRMASGSPNDGVRWELKTPIVASAGGELHFNLDFRNGPRGADETGAYRIYLGHGAIRSLAIEIGVSGEDLAVRRGGAWESIRKLEAGPWYNLRLTLDLAKRTYHGAIQRHGAPDDTTRFEQLSCAADWDGVIDTFFCDGLGHRPGPRPTRDLDNLAIQTSPFVPPVESAKLPAEQLAALRERIGIVEREVVAARGEFDALSKRPLAEQAYAVVEGTPSNARIQKRGEPDRLGEETPRRNLEILGGEALSAESLQRGSGRRELADWATRPSNPLTTRVIVNRVWQHLFGAGIVATESDFGTRGEPPTHPELLDELATRLQEREWSLKWLTRELALSRAWRLSADASSAATELDPTNRWLGRFARRPIDAESLRDSIMASSGLLDRAVPGAHPFPPVDQWNFTIHYPFSADYDSPHRSVYLMTQRQRKQPYLSLFDGADPNLSTARRLPTTTPTQALYLLNAELIHRAADRLVSRVLAESVESARNAAESESDRITALFETLLGRTPASDELAAAREFLGRYRDAWRQSARGNESRAEQGERDAWSGLTRGLMMSNGFLFVE